MILILGLLSLPIFVAIYIALNFLLVKWLNENFHHTSKYASKKLRATIKRIPIWRMNIYTILQFFGWYIFYKNSVENPGDAYQLVANIVIYTLFIMYLVINITIDFIPNYISKIQRAIEILFAIVSVIFLYIFSGFGAEWLSEVFPFSTSNIKYASSAATFFVSSSIFGLIFVFIAIAVELFIFTYAVLPNIRKNTVYKEVSIFAFFSALFISTMSIGLYIPTNSKNNFSTILVSHIALDFDSMSIESCLDNKGVDKIIERFGPLDSDYLAIIPVSTSVDKGYLLKAPQKLLTGKKLHNYSSEDREKYTPKVIDYIECDKLKYKSELPDKAASSALN